MESKNRLATTCLGLALGALFALTGACSPEAPNPSVTPAAPTLASVMPECLDYYTNLKAGPGVTLVESNRNRILAAADNDHNNREWDDLTNWTIVGTAKALDRDSEVLPPAASGLPLCIRFSVAKNANGKWEGQAQALSIVDNTPEVLLGKICDEKHVTPHIVADSAKCKVPKASFATVTATINGVLYSATADTTDAANKAIGTNLLEVAEADLRRQLVAASVAVPNKLSPSLSGGFGLWYPCVSSGCCRAY